MQAERFVAVDWSGARKVGRRIWLAVGERGRLIRLDRLRSREHAVEAVLRECQEKPRTVVGLDFPFSFPEWFLDRQGCAGDVRAFWAAARKGGLDWTKSDPFHARGTWAQGAFSEHANLRRTDRETAGSPESVFKIVGAKQVAKGAITGMAALATLAEQGLSIWPFDAPRFPMAIEIFPRVLYDRPLTKSDKGAREKYIAERLDAFAPGLPELVSSSDDAFDAAVSALRMSRAADELSSLPWPLPDYSIEGRIWVPSGVPATSHSGLWDSAPATGGS